MDEAEANTTDSDVVSYMETLASEFENSSILTGIVMDNLWQPNRVVSQPTDDESIHKGQVSGSKGKSFALLKHFP